MPRFVALLAMLVIAQHAVVAEEPTPSPLQSLEKSLKMGRYRALKSRCEALAESSRRAECLRTLETCTEPGAQAVSAECLHTLLALDSQRVCGSDDLKSDRTACLERRMDALTKELAQLRRDLPKMIEDSLRQAMEPRLHQ
jgi:hypothetical protein